MSNLWRKYTTLSPRTRIFVGAGVMTYATVALYTSDAAEKAFGLEASPAERAQLTKWVPRVSVVDTADTGSEPDGENRER